MMGFDTSLNLVCIYVTRKKNHGFWTKCGFEFNKEIKGNEAEKSWDLTRSVELKCSGEKRKQVACAKQCESPDDLRLRNKDTTMTHEYLDCDFRM